MLIRGRTLIRGWCVFECGRPKVRCFYTRHLLGGIRAKTKYFIEISVMSEISDHLLQTKVSITKKKAFRFALTIKKLVSV